MNQLLRLNIGINRFNQLLLRGDLQRIFLQQLELFAIGLVFLNHLKDSLPPSLLLTQQDPNPLP
jgi:hypothetical protein